ncbi:glycosyl hydrolase family 18 protein [Natranaerofaba carboxydovora]|uniref:glycosyl hydrolase family 18 protein n=1 Tax=Natranaerofaba carboxydovora TaxID=2742683 RepID=UPI001F12EE06|nr:glycosyl hydrolase family 18 protein [Natranaerofaba carboxydovora]UMZ74198.1 Putative sporulation-specific glycosylase YdhD [Natranaerofaba carboxydovora]
MTQEPLPEEKTEEEELKANLQNEIKKKKHFRFFWINIVIGVVLTIILLVILLYLAPGRQEASPYPPTDETRLIFEDKDLGTEHTLQKDDETYISKVFLKEHIDPYIHYDENGDYVTITSHEKVFQMQTDQLTAYVNEEETELNFPPTIHEDQPYLPADVLQEVYPVEVHYFEEDNLALLENLEEQALKGNVKENETGILREGPSIRKGIIDRLDEGEEVIIYSEENNWFFDWYYVRTPDGYLGYISKDDLTLDDVTFREAVKKETPRHVPNISMGEPISLTWEHVITNTPNPDEMPLLSGVNVISPTWFHLNNSKGELDNVADKSFVYWAHQNDKQVWALISNRFDPAKTHEFLRDPNARQNTINQLLLFSEIYNLDGINFDFENIKLKDRDYYTQFIREATPFLREQDLVVSVDVTFISESENWSKSYDRKALAHTVDFVMVMAYDEHWGDSPVAGSVASLPWVENNLEEILKKIPGEQLVLGIPFYTRLWKEEENETGEIEVSSSAYGMDRIKEILDEHDADITFDEDTKQYYAEYTNDDNRYRTWLETPESIKKRIDLVHEYDLAGVASWRRGFETDDIWDVIKENLYRPTSE